MTYAWRLTLIVTIPLLWVNVLSADFVGMTSDPGVEFVQATQNAVLGTHEIFVTQPGERAFVEATSPQIAVLAQDENLVVNGVLIELDAGLNQIGVINRINEFSDQTYAIAEQSFRNPTRTRIRSIEFGGDQTISVIADSTGTGSSGFLTTLETDHGVDIQGTIGSESATAIGGDRLVGLGIELLFLPDQNEVNTVFGTLGTVTISLVPEPAAPSLILLCLSLSWWKRQRR